MGKRVCQHCEVELPPQSKNRRYCSRKCAADATRKFKREWYLSNQGKLPSQCSHPDHFVAQRKEERRQELIRKYGPGSA